MKVSLIHSEHVLWHEIQITESDTGRYGYRVYRGAQLIADVLPVYLMVATAWVCAVLHTLKSRP